MTKLDGDARGGAALSVKAVTGKPIMFAGTGEKLDQFERFHPDRMAQRILGMGDVLSLIEKTQEQFDEDEAKQLERKLRRNEFTLDDFLEQLQQVRKMGPLSSLLGMMPGFAGEQMKGLKVDEKELDRVRGDHPVDDRRGAPPSRADQGLTPAADRARLRHERSAGQPARQAVRPDAQDHAPGRARQDARSRGDHAPGALNAGQAPATLLRRLSEHLREEPVAVRLRLTRVGSNKNPIWRVVVADQRSPRDGRFIEIVGHYNAQTNPSTITLDEERIREWIAKGAQPTDQVRKLMRTQGITA